MRQSDDRSPRKALPRRTFLRGVRRRLGPADCSMRWCRRCQRWRRPPPAGPGVSGSSTCRTAWRRTRRSTTGRRRAKAGSFEMSQILAPLEPFRDRMLVISGLDHNQAEAGDDGASGDHTRGTSSWLTGVYPKRTEGADVRNGISADQIAAAVLGKDTALPSLELGIDLNFLAGQCENSYSCAYLNTLAWTSPTTPLPTENNPRIVVRAPVRRRRHGRAADVAGAQEPEPARLGARGSAAAAAAARPRRPRHGRRLCRRRARSRAADRKGRSAERTRSCRDSTGRRGSRSGSTSTSS